MRLRRLRAIRRWVADSTWLSQGISSAIVSGACGCRRSMSIIDRTRHLVVQPDLIVVTNSRLPIVSDRVWGAPDLVIEVMSPRPRIGTLDERLGWFAQYGVRECWLVHHLSGQIEVRQFGEGTQQLFENNEPLVSMVLPQFTASLGSIVGPTYLGP